MEGILAADCISELSMVARKRKIDRRVSSEMLDELPAVVFARGACCPRAGALSGVLGRERARWDRWFFGEPGGVVSGRSGCRDVGAMVACSLVAVGERELVLLFIRCGGSDVATRFAW